MTTIHKAIGEYLAALSTEGKATHPGSLRRRTSIDRKGQSDG